MARTTSFTLGDEQNAHIAQQADCAHESASDLVQGTISALSDETRKEALWRELIEQGLTSGRSSPGVFARIRKKHVGK